MVFFQDRFLTKKKHHLFWWGECKGKYISFLILIMVVDIDIDIDPQR